MNSDDEDAKRELGEKEYALYNKNRLELEEETDNYSKEAVPKLQAIINTGLFEHVEINENDRKWMQICLRRSQKRRESPTMRKDVELTHSYAAC